MSIGAHRQGATSRARARERHVTRLDAKAHAHSTTPDNGVSENRATHHASIDHANR